MKHETTASRLRFALNMRGMTQQQLADASGVSKYMISHYVNGRHAITNMTAPPMAKVLKVNPLWLMGFDVEMREPTESDRITLSLTAEEMAVINQYRCADDAVKKVILKILNITRLNE